MIDVRIGPRAIGPSHPTYFIADIGANHDGDLDRARALIALAAASGADAAKFQHFAASTIVSDHGFRNLVGEDTHQSSWKQSVFEVYKSASIDLSWTDTLASECRAQGIEFMTSPYDVQLLDAVDPYVRAHKIGSGDITWLEMVQAVAERGKPVLLATGASTLDEVRAAVDVVHRNNSQLVLMQCNTNYTGAASNFSYTNLRVLNLFAQEFPGVVLGLSDHTSGHATTLGAVALGARVVEKHFTDDRSRIGPDHGFAMDPISWSEMVARTRELEASLGDGVKRLEANELGSVVVQRRSLRANGDIPAGTTITAEHVCVLRPCPPDAFPPTRLDQLIGRRTTCHLVDGEAFTDATLA